MVSDQKNSASFYHKWIPKSIKRLIFITTLYKNFCDTLDIECNLDALKDQFKEFIPNTGVFKFPLIFTEKVWSDQTFIRKEVDQLAIAETTVVLKKTPVWLRYEDAIMRDDIFLVFGLAMADFHDKVATQKALQKQEDDTA